MKTKNHLSKCYWNEHVLFHNGTNVFFIPSPDVNESYDVQLLQKANKVHIGSSNSSEIILSVSCQSLAKDTVTASSHAAPHERHERHARAEEEALVTVITNLNTHGAIYLYYISVDHVKPSSSSSRQTPSRSPSLVFHPPRLLSKKSVPASILSSAWNPLPITPFGQTSVSPVNEGSVGVNGRGRSYHTLLCVYGGKQIFVFLFKLSSDRKTVYYIFFLYIFIHLYIYIYIYIHTYSYK